MDSRRWLKVVFREGGEIHVRVERVGISCATTLALTFLPDEDRNAMASDLRCHKFEWWYYISLADIVFYEWSEEGSW
jgi:hypothetical protein